MSNDPTKDVHIDYVAPATLPDVMQMPFFPVNPQDVQDQKGGPLEIPAPQLPQNTAATQLIGKEIDTHARKVYVPFGFAAQGMLQLGKYVKGVSGDIQIDDKGLRVRDKTGAIVFQLTSDGVVTL